MAIYDIVRKQWKSHFFFKQQVFGLLRNQISKEMHELNVGVLLENGEIQLIDNPKTRYGDWTLDTTQVLKVEGKIQRVVSDWRDISSHYILSLLPTGKASLFGFQRNKVQCLDDQIMQIGSKGEKIPGINAGDELIRCVTQNEKEDFLIFNMTEGRLRTYTNNASRNEGTMKITLCRKIKISNLDEPTI